MKRHSDLHRYMHNLSSQNVFFEKSICRDCRTFQETWPETGQFRQLTAQSFRKQQVDSSILSVGSKCDQKKDPGQLAGVFFHAKNMGEQQGPNDRYQPTGCGDLRNHAGLRSCLRSRCGVITDPDLVDRHTYRRRDSINNQLLGRPLRPYITVIPTNIPGMSH